MIEQSKEYLIQKLKDAGIKSKIFTTMKELKAHQNSHVGAVIPDSDIFERSFNKKIYSDNNNLKHKRRKMFERHTTFVVVIGEYQQDKADEIFENFLASLDPGIVINGNYTPIEVEEADWVAEQDSILKAAIAVQLKVKFVGGIYKDTDFARVGEYEVRNIERLKEDGNGSI
ncbi:SON protein [Paenibacillus alvei]|uniref:SON protein n=1 Tax=Paenibacillus alvei TaxID=44250 RepID=A0ABT4H9A7_PAEAL|nr:SON protein [Paenibacillus alvei]MCY9765201.1 SON protein [Paenibacillus alvei]MCY9771446.1 SON protein [Paenibacillus alvei]